MFSAAAVRRWLKFGLVGGANTAVDFGAFALLALAGVPYLAAQGVSCFCGMLNGYRMNRGWTFRDRARTRGAFLRYAAVSLAALALTEAALYVASDRWRWPVLAGKLAATGLGWIVNYAGSSRWAFRVPIPSERSDAR